MVSNGAELRSEYLSLHHRHTASQQANMLAAVQLVFYLAANGSVQ